MKANQDIRNYMEKNRITIWQLGIKLNVSENTMIRRLRMELPDQEKAVVLAVLAEIVKEREA